MREPFLERIDKRPVVCDGAMGTMLYSKGIPLNRCYDELNAAMPQLVKEVHLAYVKAGAEVLETNTFGANKFRLEKFGLGEKVREFNLAGARLAREVAGDDLYVAGAVGPLGIRLEPLGLTTREEARAAFREQIAVLVEGRRRPDHYRNDDGFERGAPGAAGGAGSRPISRHRADDRSGRWQHAHRNAARKTLRGRSMSGVRT